MCTPNSLTFVISTNFIEHTFLKNGIIKVYFYKMESQEGERIALETLITSTSLAVILCEPKGVWRRHNLVAIVSVCEQRPMFLASCLDELICAAVRY